LTATIGAELKGQGINGLNNTQQLDEGMSFISGLTDESRRRGFFVKQGIKIATRRQRFRNFLKVLRVIAYSTIGSIRKHLRRNFSIKFGRFPWTYSHFTTVSEYQH